jgi:hypothetical protein
MMPKRQIREIIAGHEARNSELLAIFMKKNVDLDVKRQIDLHFWVTDKRNAEALKKSLERKGFLIQRLVDTGNKADFPWNLEAGGFQSISQTIATEFTSDLADGWPSFRLKLLTAPILWVPHPSRS